MNFAQSQDSLKFLFEAFQTVKDSLHVVKANINSPQVNTLENYYFFSQIISSAVLIGYAIYTAKTYTQIKKQTSVLTAQSQLLEKQTILISQQTENLLNPLLTVEFYKFGTLPDMKLRYPETEILDDQLDKSFSIFSKAKVSMQLVFKNFDDSLFQTGIIAVHIYNHGNSAAKKIDLCLKVESENSKELTDTYTIANLSDKCNYNIEKHLHSRKSFTIPLIFSGAFPKFKIQLSGSYTDIRDKVFNIEAIQIEGENPHLLKLPNTKLDP